MTCTAPEGSGCFSVFTNNNFFAFCGQSSFANGSAGLENVNLGFYPTLSKVACESITEDEDKACYCDNANYCNVKGKGLKAFSKGATSLPKPVPMTMLGSILILLALIKFF